MPLLQKVETVDTGAIWRTNLPVRKTLAIPGIALGFIALTLNRSGGIILRLDFE
jgi:hypothetical protein